MTGEPLTLIDVAKIVLSVVGFLLVVFICPLIVVIFKMVVSNYAAANARIDTLDKKVNDNYKEHNNKTEDNRTLIMGLEKTVISEYITEIEHNNSIARLEKCVDKVVSSVESLTKITAEMNTTLVNKKNRDN